MQKLRSPEGEWLIEPVRPAMFEAFAWSDAPVVMAVVDTGVCTDYPPLTGRILDQVDLTGEGVVDENGHGTSVTAVLLAHNSPRAEVISVKALDRRGDGSIGRLCLGMWKAAELLRGRGSIINLSAGRRTPSCEGDCPLCSTAKQIEAEGFMVLAAAGNTVGVTYCPAKSVAFAVTTNEAHAAPGSVRTELPLWTRLTSG